MLWMMLSLLTALAVATQDAWVKKYFSGLSPYEMMAYPVSYSLPLFAIAVWFVPVPALDPIFYWCFLASLPLNGVSFLLYMAAIKTSPLSLTIPYLAFTPMFMVCTGTLFLGEIPNKFGFLGILLTCAGGYALNFKSGNPDYLAPLKAVFRETGSWLMLIVAFLFSFAAVIGKKGILHSSPFFFTMSFFCAFPLFLLLSLLLAGKIKLNLFKKFPLLGLVAGTLFFIQALSHGWAISLTKAAYMISVKRLSVIFSVLYGALLFKEQHIVVRFLGAALMLCGAVLILVMGQ